MKQCWKGDASSRPQAQTIARHLLDPNVQALLGECYVPTSRSVRQAVFVQQTGQVWLCCNDRRGSDVLILNAKTMTVMRQFDIEDYQVWIRIAVHNIFVFFANRKTHACAGGVQADRNIRLLI